MNKINILIGDFMILDVLKRFFFCLSLLLCISGITLKHIIDSTMIAVVYSSMPIACAFLAVSLVLLMIYTFTKGNASKYILILTMVLLTIKQFLWSGSIASIILYIIIVISLFKPTQQKALNIVIIVDCIIKSLQTILYITDNITYYDSLYYASPYITCLLASLCASIGVWLIAFKPISK